MSNLLFPRRLRIREIPSLQMYFPIFIFKSQPICSPPFKHLFCILFRPVRHHPPERAGVDPLRGSGTVQIPTQLAATVDRRLLRHVSGTGLTAW